MVRIRLQRRGRRKQPFYHIVIADSRAPRDGRFIEKIGTYNPMTKPATIDLNRDLAFEWLLKGAQPSDTVRAILRVKGVMFRKHLHRGVVKGALTQEQADAKYQEYIDKKEASFAERAQQTAKEAAEQRRKVAGKKPVIATPEPEAEAETPEVADAEVAGASEDAVAQEATTVTEDQSVAQDAPEPVEAAADAPEASAPGEEPAEVAEAASPNAVNAAAETDTAEPDHQSAGDKAEDAAEAVADAAADAEATKEA